MKNRCIQLWIGLLVIIGTIHCAGLKPNPQFNEPNSSKNDSGKIVDHNLNDRVIASSFFEKRLVQQIESYMGVPYRWGGTSSRGMDCSGFVSTVYVQAINLKLPRSAKKMFNRGQYIAQRELKLGDLVFFENIENRGVSHVGIYVGDLQFAHASAKRGVIVSDLNEKYYRERYVGARRIYRDE